MEEMLDDVRHELLPVDSENPPQPLDYEDPPTAMVQKFFELLKAAKEPLHEHTKVTILVFVTRLMAIKSKFAFSLQGASMNLFASACLKMVQWRT
jgi:hypothetical protein